MVVRRCCIRSLRAQHPDFVAFNILALGFPLAGLTPLEPQVQIRGSSFNLSPRVTIASLYLPVVSPHPTPAPGGKWP